MWLAQSQKLIRSGKPSWTRASPAKSSRLLPAAGKLPTLSSCCVSTHALAAKTTTVGLLGRHRRGHWCHPDRKCIHLFGLDGGSLQITFVRRRVYGQLQADRQASGFPATEGTETQVASSHDATPAWPLSCNSGKPTYLKRSSSSVHSSNHLRSIVR